MLAVLPDLPRSIIIERIQQSGGDDDMALLDLLNNPTQTVQVPVIQTAPQEIAQKPIALEKTEEDEDYNSDDNEYYEEEQEPDEVYDGILIIRT